MTQASGSLSGVRLGDPRRRIELPGVLNFRDVGGYPVAGGGSVRWRTLFRSDALHELDAAGLAAIAGLRVKTVIDLRTKAEAAIAPSPVAGRALHVPLLTGDLQDLPLELSALYRYVIDECGAAIAAAVAALSADDAVPALVHCSAGKDRTGVVIALVLAVLGVPDEVIAADYALSSVYLDPNRTPVIGQLRAGTGLGAELTAALLASPPALILDVLHTTRERAGSVEGYLRAHGLGDAALTRLRSALIV